MRSSLRGRRGGVVSLSLGARELPLHGGADGAKRGRRRREGLDAVRASPPRRELDEGTTLLRAASIVSVPRRRALRLARVCGGGWSRTDPAGRPTPPSTRRFGAGGGGGSLRRRRRRRNVRRGERRGSPWRCGCVERATFSSADRRGRAGELGDARGNRDHEGGGTIGLLGGRSPMSLMLPIVRTSTRFVAAWRARGRGGLQVVAFPARRERLLARVEQDARGPSA